ncbi:MAG: hypothetical protein KF754_04670 [Planctomycetes bacterium]|nr:hypothetical protein [Planctomycetota bacterium]
MVRATLLAMVCLLGGGLSAQFGNENYLEATTQPAAGSVPAGTTQRHCLSFGLMRLDTNSDDFGGLVVRNNGTAQASDYSQIQLWFDANDSDTLETGGPDYVVGSATSGAFPRALTMSPQTHQGLSVYNYFVTVDVSATAVAGRTFIFEVTVADVSMLNYPVVLFATPPVGPTQTISASAGPNQIVVSTQPGGAQAGTAFTTQPVVQLRNSSGVLLSGDSTTQVTAAITSGTGTSGATLGGTVTVQASGGVVTFTNLSINLAGTAYTLTFTTTGFTSAVSATFNVTTTQVATQLAITTQPGGAQPGVAFTSQPVIEIRDATGAVVAGASNFVGVSLNGGSGGTLSGTLIVQAVNGVATFSNLSINNAGVGYSLTFSASGLTGATSSTFNVTGAGGASGGGGGGGGGCVVGQASGLPLLAITLAALACRRRRLGGA